MRSTSLWFARSPDLTKPSHELSMAPPPASKLLLMLARAVAVAALIWLVAAACPPLFGSRTGVWLLRQQRLRFRLTGHGHHSIGEVPESALYRERFRAGLERHQHARSDRALAGERSGGSRDRGSEHQLDGLGGTEQPRRRLRRRLLLGGRRRANSQRRDRPRRGSFLIRLLRVPAGVRREQVHTARPARHRRDLAVHS